MLKNRVRIGNMVFIAFAILLFFSYYFAVTTPIDQTDGSFRKKDFLIGTIYSDDSPLEEGDVITHINGESLEKIIENRFQRGEVYDFKVGDELIYTVDHNGTISQVPIKLESLSKTHLLKFSYNYIVAFAIGLIGYLAFITSPQTDKTLSFLLMCVGMGITIAPGIFEAFNISFPLYMTILYLIIGPISGISLIAVPFFFLTFPTDLLKQFKRAYVLINLAIVASLTIIPLFLNTTVMAKHYNIVQGFYFFVLYIAVSFLAGIFLNFLRTRDLIRKQQLKYIGIGIILSAIPGITFLLLPFIIDREVPISYEVLTTIFLIFPLTTLFALKRFQLFDVKKIINKTLTYALTSFFTTAISILLFALFSFILRFSITSKTIISLVPVLIFTSVSAIPFQNLVEDLWQKLFHRKVLEFFKAERVVITDLAQAKDYDGICNYVSAILPNHLQIKNSLIIFVKEDGFYIKDEFLYKNWELILKSDENDFKLLKNLPFISYIDEIPAIKNKKIKKYSIAVPILQDGKTVALWLLGEKASEDFYSREELEIISVISKQLGLSLQNAKLLADIEEKLRKEKAVVEKELELNKLKGEYITIISHFLRTPITAAKGYIDLLQKEIKGKRINEYLIGLSASTQKVHTITERIIIMSELEKGRLKISMREGSLADMLKDVVENAQPTAKEYEISTKLVIKHKPQILAERNKLKQAIGNILENAIIYNKPQGSVKLRLERIDNNAIITIQDTGRGISNEEQEKLFTPFHRAHFEEEGFIKGEGIGIGIYLSKLIIKAHKGTIKYESIVGTGTTVTISIPISKN